MCSIIGSYDRNVFLQLAELNSYRGVVTSSIACLDHNDRPHVSKFDGKITDERLPLKDNILHLYTFGHQQAPTSDEQKNVHPSTLIGKEDQYSFLWHNGIIKPSTITLLNMAYGGNSLWDTKLLHAHLCYEGFKGLDAIDGSFACIFYNDKKFYMFRNELVPLYIDDVINISSTKFEGSRLIPANVVFELDFINANHKEVYNFHTKENPYYFAEEE